MPSASYAEAAARGRLWVAIDESDQLAGYLFFGGRFPNISVTQLFVSADARKNGIGHELVNQLKQYAQQMSIQTISARVAADLEANIFWEKSGFLLLRQMPGGRTTNRTINVRLHEVSQSSLWQSDTGKSAGKVDFLASRPSSIVPNYVLDLNVFFDVVKQRAEAESGARLLGAAMANRIRVCVTSEFVEELRRHTKDEAADPLLNLAKNLPALPPIPKNLLESRLAELRKIIFPDANRSSTRKANDDSDLIHLATCIHHKTSAFVTREKAILRASNELERRFQLEVVSPVDILDSESEFSPDSGSIKAHIDGESFYLESMSESLRAQAEQFLGSKVGLASSVIQKLLDPGTDQSRRVRLIAQSGDELIGYCSYSYSATPRSEVDGFVAVDEMSGGAQQFIDHALQRIATEVPLRVPTLVSLSTCDHQQQVISTALNRSYQLEERREDKRLLLLRRVAYRGVISENDWSDFKRKLQRSFAITLPQKCPTFLEARNTGIPVVQTGDATPRPWRLFNFETFFAPLLLALPGRPGTVVPIREGYAQELLQLAVAQMSLLPTKEAQLRIERAYFGKSGFEKAFERDGLVVFYISGHGVRGMTAVGVARITYAGKVSVVKARTELMRYGVLELSTLEESVDKNGNIGVFTFDNFTPFEVPISYNDLCRLGCVGGANLVTAQKLTGNQLQKIIQAGFKKID
ncbi:MAG: GNAT family N-acetyltransferase [Burkholderiales bacterium]|nr:GNAT family N-acetyltransferase [Burkholderiales bacterium]